jgi:glyceraldehyde 3-phosphate dehydrogenase
MAIRVGINGFGRMGRLALRAGWGQPDLQFVHINEVAGGPDTAAHLLTFDSVHGRWNRRVEARDGQIQIDGTAVAFSALPSLPSAADGRVLSELSSATSDAAKR